MKQEIYIGTSQALSLAEEKGFTMTLPTLIALATKNKIGKQLRGGGKWYIDKTKFTELIGDGGSLE